MFLCIKSINNTPKPFAILIYENSANTETAFKFGCDIINHLAQLHITKLTNIDCNVKALQSYVDMNKNAENSPTLITDTDKIHDFISNNTSTKRCIIDFNEEIFTNYCYNVCDRSALGDDISDISSFRIHDFEYIMWDMLPIIVDSIMDRYHNKTILGEYNDRIIIKI